MPRATLPECRLGRAYFYMFWTIEVDPSQPDEIERQKVANVFKGIRASAKIYVAKEVSKTGYHHIHVVNKWAKTRKWEPIKKKLVKAMKFAKANGKEVSVRVFHPRHGGTEDYEELVGYLVNPKNKTKMTDDNAIEFHVENYCSCGFLGMIAICSCDPDCTCSCPPVCPIDWTHFRWCRCGAKRCACVRG